MSEAFFGQQAEIRVGAMADAATDPTAWENLEYVTLTLNPGRAEQERPLIGVALHNRLDQRETEAGLTSVTVELVVPFGTRQTPRWLALGYGLPASAPAAGQAGLYAHAWETGEETPRYFALQLRTGANQVKVIRGLTLSALSLESAGETVNAYNLSLNLAGLSEEARSDWLGSAPAQAPPDAQTSAVKRVVFKSGAAEAARCQSASWSYDRSATPDVFLSRDPSASSVTPEGGAVSGQAVFRSMASEYDAIEVARTTFAATLEGVGRISGHKVELAAPNARFQASPTSIDGPGQVSRTWSWRGHQTAASPAGRIVITNDVESYA